jgi:hypothetical protein
MEQAPLAFQHTSSVRERPRLLLQGIGSSRRAHVNDTAQDVFPGQSKSAFCAFASIAFAGQQPQPGEACATAVQVHNGLQSDQLVWAGDRFKLGDSALPGEGASRDLSTGLCCNV